MLRRHGWLTGTLTYSPDFTDPSPEERLLPSPLLRALSRDVLFWATLPFLLTLGVSLCFVPHLAIAVYLFLSKPEMGKILVE